MNRIGTCSECGGPVVVPSHSVWPTPYCTDCGAIASAGPRVQMIPGSGNKRPLPETRPSPHDDEYR